MRKQLLVPLSVAALALGAATLASATPDTEGGASATKRVKVGDYFFKKRAITIERGDRVRWVWVGRDLHDVTVTRGPRKFHSRTKRNGSFAKRLLRPGTYRYICTVHPIDMRAKVVVE